MKPVGHIDHVNRFYVVGWAADLDNVNNSVRLTVFIDGNASTTVEASQFRSDLDKIAPGATGKYAFRCYFPVPLLPYKRHEVVLQIAETEFSIRAEVAALEPGPLTEPDEIHRPRGPILLTSLGRSGSTAIMAILAQHSEIVVAGDPPYEVELGCYYANAFRTLTAAGDHERSLRPDQITSSENYYHIGFNPSLDPSYTLPFLNSGALHGFIMESLPRRMGAAFRDIILDYYAAVARIQDKKHPFYFAEKMLPVPDSRLGLRYFFPDTKEIVLVRDLRDVVCSFRSHGQTPFSKAVEGAISAAHRFLEIQATPDANTFFLRYEDFVLKKTETLDRMFEFLGLRPIEYASPEMEQLFASHGTSQSPSESIGRWKRDLSAEQLEECQPFEPFLKSFGYESSYTTVTREPENPLDR